MMCYVLHCPFVLLCLFLRTAETTITLTSSSSIQGDEDRSGTEVDQNDQRSLLFAALTHLEYLAVLWHSITPSLVGLPQHFWLTWIQSQNTWLHLQKLWTTSAVSCSLYYGLQTWEKTLLCDKPATGKHRSNCSVLSFVSHVILYMFSKVLYSYN